MRSTESFPRRSSGLRRAAALLFALIGLAYAVWEPSRFARELRGVMGRKP